MSFDRITSEQLAERWGVTVRTLELYRKNGEGPPYVRIGPRSIFYRLQDIEAYERAQTVGRENLEPSGWRDAMKRAAGALDLVAKRETKPKARATLEKLRDEIRTLLS